MAVDMSERYRAAMVLSAVGDALGYKNGSFEFCYCGQDIHKEVEKHKGIDAIKVEMPNWMVSDDTVMHLATSEALTECGNKQKEDLYRELARNYIECMKDMKNRAPGLTTSSSINMLDPDKPDWKDGCRIPFLHRKEDLTNLIEVSVESGWMTHHNPTGYLGSLASALFTSYSIQGRDYFKSHWEAYLKGRQKLDGKSNPVFPQNYGVEERDKYYNSLNPSGWGGSSGLDAPMIAYDAILGAGDNWHELRKRAKFHGGDSDSTGVIAACCFGAMYGFNGVPENNYKCVEYRKRLEEQAAMLYRLAYEDRTWSTHLNPKQH